VIETLLDRFGDGTVLLMAGLLTGLLFGVAAQRSQFCLRASTVELARGQIGPRMAIWLIVFATALASTQALIMTGRAAGVRCAPAVRCRQPLWRDYRRRHVRHGHGPGPWLRQPVAGAVGHGQPARAVTGLVLTLVAQSALSGVLAPAREAISAFG
jgi:hypothetical protein